MYTLVLIYDPLLEVVSVDFNGGEKLFAMEIAEFDTTDLDEALSDNGTQILLDGDKRAIYDWFRAVKAGKDPDLTSEWIVGEFNHY